MNTNDQIKAIAQGIIQCALFADKPEGTNPRVTRQAKQAAEALAAQFVRIIGVELLNDAVEAYGGEYGGSYRDAALRSIGHDVGFTMRGHGVGFWDRKELKLDCDNDPIDLADRLTEACRKLKHREPTFYRGWLYIE